MLGSLVVKALSVAIFITLNFGLLLLISDGRLKTYLNHIQSLVHTFLYLLWLVLGDKGTEIS